MAVKRNTVQKAPENITPLPLVQTGETTSFPTDQSAPSSTRNDGWTSALKGIGGGRDARTSSQYLGDNIIPKNTLNELYIGDGLVRRIIDLVPDEIFRVPGSVQNDPTDKYDEGLISYEMSRRNCTSTLSRAKKLARLTGGSILYIGATGSGSPQEELIPSKIKNIEFLKVFDLNDIQTWDCKFNTDIESPGFGKVELYSVIVRVGDQAKTHYLHASRCIPFYGAPVPSASFRGNTLEIRHWGLSILQFMYPDIRDFRLAFANTAGILGEFVIGKYKFSDLDEILATGNEKKLQSRIAGIEMSKSIINAVMLGTDEEYSRDSASVSGLSDLLDRFMMLVSASTGYPVTKLFGRSASGLNATGEGDQKSYYDTIRSEMTDLQPYVQKLVDIFVGWKGLPDGDYTYHWGNLYQPTAHEEAELNRIVAETFRTNMDGMQRAISEGVISTEQGFDLFFKDRLNRYEEPEVEGDVDDDAIISATGKDKSGNDEPESKTDELQKEDSLEVPDENRKGIISRIKKALFGNRSKG
jgi:uncharacterized protein